MKPERQVIFPPFRLDPANQRLWRDEKVISLRPKSFAVLHYLSERPGRLVTKDELLDRVWPETAVGDAVLKGCVREIREALEDDPSSPRFIETAHRRGYRFIGRVTEGGSTAAAPQHSADTAALNTPPRPSCTHASPLTIGRGAELNRLQGWSEKALRGERQLVFVTGEPGIGKTTVVEAFLEQFTAAPGLRIARGQCLEQYGAGEAYLPVLEALGRLCRAPDGSRLIGLLRRYAPVWLAQMPGLVDADEREALQREIASATPERMLREMAEAIEALTEEVPLVLVLEDLHWSDYSTLDLLSSIARRPEPARLLIIGTYRPVEMILNRHPLKAVKQELQMHRRCEELPLEYLSETAVAEYLGTRLPQNHFTNELARVIHRRTDGNPLFMINVVDYLLAGGSISQRDGRWELQVALEEIELGVPENVRQMIEKQIERLSPDEQRVLGAASAAGVEFSAVAVAAGLDEDVAQVEQWCEDLTRRHQFLQPAPLSELPDGTLTPRYSFIHALYQHVLYDRVTATRRARLHQRIGERVEMLYGDRAVEIAAELAMHFEQGRDARRAVKYLQQAAENAARRFANQEVVTLSRRGLELLQTLPATPDRAYQELDLLMILGPALIVTTGYGSSDVEQAYARARELCEQLGEAPRLFAAIWGLAGFYMMRQLQTARELGEKLLSLAEDTRIPAYLPVSHQTLGAPLFYLGELTLARKHLERAVALYGSGQHYSAQPYVSDHGVVSNSFAAITLWCLGYPDQALQRSRAALTIARELSHPFSLAFALSFAAWLHQLRGERQAVLEHAEAAITLATEHGFPYWMASATFGRCWALIEHGHEKDVIAEMRRGLGVWRAIGSDVLQPYLLALLAEAYGKGGRTEEGLSLLVEAQAVMGKSAERFFEAEIYRLRGELSLALPAENRAEVPACFQQAIEIARRQEAKSLELRAVMSLYRLYRKHGRRGEQEESRRMLVETYAWFTEGFDTADLQEAGALLREFP